MDRRRPNILFLLSDEHSFRCLSYLDIEPDAEPVHTPTLDALAEGGVAFDRAYCMVPLCTPSRICMLTGCFPMKSGGWDNSARMNPERPTIASTFSDAGYATCLVGKMHLGGPRQFAGFQYRPYGDLTGAHGHQPDPLLKKGAGLHGMRTRTLDAGVTTIPEGQLQERQVNEAGVSWLREQRHRDPLQPWFMMASYSRPHFPLTAPKRWVDRYWPDGVTEPMVGRTGDTAEHPMTRGMVEGFKTEQITHEEMMYARACYFANVSFLDEILGDLLNTLDRDRFLENTIIVYTSDHGELAGEHGLWWKNSWHEAAARVPLIVSTPMQRSMVNHALPEPPGLKLRPVDDMARPTSPVSLADLYPTLCSMAEIEHPDDLDGEDLSGAIWEEFEPERDEPVLVVNPVPRWGEGTQNATLVDYQYKYVAFAGADVPDLMFDLWHDPLEQTNLLPAAEGEVLEQAESMRAQIAARWDFDEAEHAEADATAAAKAEPWRVDQPRYVGNIYHLPDGRLVAADKAIYDSDVIADTAATLIADAPQQTVDPPPQAARKGPPLRYLPREKKR